jgi:hypothetical protein
MEPAIGHGVENKLADRKALVRSKLKARAAITNGSSLFMRGVDGRSREARRYRDLFRHYVAQADGQHEELCKQAASLVVRRELLDAAMVSGAPVDVLAVTRLAGAINRTLAKLNLLGGEPGSERRRREREDREAGLIA